MIHSKVTHHHDADCSYFIRKSLRVSRPPDNYVKYRCQKFGIVSVPSIFCPKDNDVIYFQKVVRKIRPLGLRNLDLNSEIPAAL